MSIWRSWKSSLGTARGLEANMMPKSLRKISINIVLFVVLIFISIFYIDKIFVQLIEYIPIYEENPTSQLYLSFLTKISSIPFVIFGLSPFLILVSIFSFLYCKRVKKFYLVIFLSAISIEVGTSIKSIFKFLFSRNNVNHFLKYNDDNFLWLKDIHSLSAFPSGHTIAIVSFLAVFWITYPKFRIFYLFISVLIFSTLMLLKFHFLSDILAGILLGWIVGYLIIILFKFFAKKEYSTLL